MTSSASIGQRGLQAYARFDGKQSDCAAAGGDAGTLQIITDLHQTWNVGTFVVGFGSEIDPAQMNAFADAGGVPKADPVDHYYQADDQASLDAALAAIAAQTIGCVFDLEVPPEDPAKVFVFFDSRSSVPRDTSHMNGWGYDPAENQVTFYGAACDQLKKGLVTDVDVVFGYGVSTPD